MLGYQPIGQLKASLKEDKMSTNDFYQEIEHTPAQWRQYRLHVPLFYQDFMFISVTILTPKDRRKA